MENTNELVEVDNSEKPDSRREFLMRLLAGSATATVLMVFGPGVNAHGPETHGSQSLGDGEHKYAYVIDINKCIGCGNCVRACSRENNVPADHFRTWVERYVVRADGVYVDSPKGAIEGFGKLNKRFRDNIKLSRTVPKMCNHCHNPPCVQVCPVGATFKSPEGFVLVDRDYCMACGYCVQACPYAARFINPVEHKSDKCTWCYHRVKKGLLPACVTVCPQKARLFGDLNDVESEVSKIFEADQWMVLKPEMHTDPTCFYIGLPREVV